MKSFTVETLEGLLIVLDKRLHNYSMRASLSEVVYDLINAADRQGWVEDLISVAAANSQEFAASVNSLWPDLPKTEDPLDQVIARKISESDDDKDASGGEVELALRSLLEVIRKGDSLVPEQYMLAKFGKSLGELFVEFDKQHEEVAT